MFAIAGDVPAVGVQHDGAAVGGGGRGGGGRRGGRRGGLGARAARACVA